MCVCVCVGDVEDERGNEQYEALTCSFMLIKRSPAAASVSEKLKGEEKTERERKKRMGSFSISLDFSPFPYK